ncbi:RNA-directed DNA polymerase, eukaryota, reverse transcriptase zinc-binding domain protein [Tanacetum coccineum]
MSTTPIVEKIRKIENLIRDGKVNLVDDEGVPVKKVEYPSDYDSEDEVASVDNGMARFIASEKVGYNTTSQKIPGKLQAICENWEAFRDNVGVSSWFSKIRQAFFDINPDGHIVWVEIEGVPLKLWTLNTFKRIVTRWGNLIDTNDSDGNCFHSKRLCLFTKSISNIYENFKIIFRGKVYWIRAKEVPGWTPDLVEDSDEEELSDDDSLEEGMKNLESENDCSNSFEVPDTVFENEGGSKKDSSVDPFGLYPLLNKKTKDQKHKESGTNSSPKFPPGFTPNNDNDDTGDKKSVNDFEEEKLNEDDGDSNNSNLKENVDESASFGRFKKSVAPSLAQKAKKDWAKELCVKNKVNFLAIQETKMEEIDLFSVRRGVWLLNGIDLMIIAVYAPHDPRDKRMLWDYLAHVINQWQGEVVIMGDFNEVRVKSDRIDSLNLRERRANIDMRFPKTISEDQSQDLEREVSKQEIKTAVWGCGTDKSPGPDGFSFGFYRHFWPVIEHDVYMAVNHFFIHGEIPPGCNSSFIALIPKVPDANLVKDFRPISLIGSIYKIIAKILSIRLVKVLGDIVNARAIAFIAERQMLDGPFILNEILQWCTKKKKKTLIFKVDFEKAFDSIRWDFLDDVLKEFGEWSDGNISTLIHVLKCFFHASGLKINLNKSKIMGINVESAQVIQAAAKLGCLVLKCPFYYLGLDWSVGVEVSSRKKDSLWTKVIVAIHGVGGKIHSEWTSTGKSCWLSILSEVRSLQRKELVRSVTMCLLADDGIESGEFRVYFRWPMLGEYDGDLPSIDMSCPICDNAIESTDHLFFRCGLVRDIANKVLSWWNLDHAKLELLCRMGVLGLFSLYGFQLKKMFGRVWYSIWCYVLDISKQASLFDERKPSKSMLIDNVIASSFYWSKDTINVVFLHVVDETVVAYGNIIGTDVVSPSVIDEPVVKKKQSLFVDTSIPIVEKTGLSSYPPLPTQGSTSARNTPGGNGVDVVVPMESIRAICESSMDGLNVMLENGPWFIRNHPLVPVTAFSEYGLSAIVMKIDTPLMLESYTSDMCLQSWGGSSYTRAMIELRAVVELKDTIVVAMPKLTGEGFLHVLFVLNMSGNPLDVRIVRFFVIFMRNVPRI